MYLTSKTSGPTGDYGISVGAASWNTSYFSSPSFTISAPGSLTGGDAGGTPASGGLNEAYAYDPFGNLTQSGNFSFSQSFTALNQMSSGYNYDAKGEGLNDIFGDALSYDANGMLTSVANGAETYVYDAQSNRVEVHGSTVTDFIYFNGRPIAMLNGSSYTDLIYAGNSLIAEVSGTQNGVPTYRAVDSLGSLQGDAQSSGPLTGAVNYAPYGQIFTGSTSDPFQFASLEWDSTSAMYHAGYRQFSPQQGRWMTADPYGGSYSLEDPQSLNRYAYVNGNPLDSTDPSGLAGAGIFTGIGGAPCKAFGATMSISGTGLSFNPCNPLGSSIADGVILASAYAMSLNTGDSIASLIGETKTVNGSWVGPSGMIAQIGAVVGAAITIGCSIDSSSSMCGQTGWTGALIGGDAGKAVGDSIAVAEAVACVAVPGAGCLADAIYTIANDLFSVFWDLFGPGPSFKGSLLPRPGVPNQSDILRILGVPINGANRDMQLHQKPQPQVPSPGMIFLQSRTF